MPWCASCDRFLSPPTVTPEGHCPTCGRPVEPGQAHGPEEHAVVTGERTSPNGEQVAVPAEDDLGPVPLHLKILGVALVVYLGWRFVQGIDWVVQRF